MLLNINVKNFLIVGASTLALAACEDGFDLDLRDLGNGFDTTSAARQATANRPAPDSRGVISYPNYQVAVARRGDTLADIASRIGLPVGELSRYNGIPLETVLRQGEVIALPRRVAEPSPSTGAIASGPIRPSSEVDIASLAGDAIERAGGTAGLESTVLPQTGFEPVRHRVEQGETAYTIARLYNVSVRSLADWNGLGSDLSVRSGQFLLIPTATDDQASSTLPGEGSPTPRPPSADTELPKEEPATTVETPPSPNLGADKTVVTASNGYIYPVKGNIIRAYSKGKNDGIDISAPAGTPVKASADGTVAAITRDTDQVPIIVLRHADNILTVYAGVDSVSVKKGDTVKRGQSIAKVRAGTGSFLHFEVRRGLESVDPEEFLN